MANASDNRISKKRAGPKGSTGALLATGVTALRLPKELTAAVEDWAARQPDRPARSEAFRRLVEMGLAVSPARRSTNPKAAAKASDMAAVEIDRMVDQTAP